MWETAQDKSYLETDGWGLQLAGPWSEFRAMALPPDQACTCVQDLVDSDTLLDEDDLKKPDPASLRATCGDGAVKKKKACKDWLEKQLDLKTF